VGAHDLWAINPSGQVSALPSAIRQVLHMFLPVLVRRDSVRLRITKVLRI
jgi:hypothetical protein